MNIAVNDFEKWISQIKGMERVNEIYERGNITLLEYIDLAKKQMVENLKEERKRSK